VRRYLIQLTSLGFPGVFARRCRFIEEVREMEGLTLAALQRIKEGEGRNLSLTLLMPAGPFPPEIRLQHFSAIDVHAFALEAEERLGIKWEGGRRIATASHDGTTLTMNGVMDVGGGQPWIVRVALVNPVGGDALVFPGGIVETDTLALRDRGAA
jgi:hypothetical protein